VTVFSFFDASTLRPDERDITWTGTTALNSRGRDMASDSSTYNECCGVPLPGVHGGPRRLVSLSRVSLPSSPSRPPDPHEVKHGGFRILALKPPRGADFTYRSPAITEAVRRLQADDAVIDLIVGRFTLPKMLGCKVKSPAV
jgi:hypothetical protein